MEYQIINSIGVTIPKKALLERIGGDEKHQPVSHRLAAQMEKASEEICTHAKPQAIFKVVPVNRNNGSVHLDEGPALSSKRVAYVLKPCDKAVAFLITLGEKVDRLIKKETDEHPQYGYVLDAAASVAADTVAETVQDFIENKLSDEKATTFRYSPGYCDWPLEEQKTLFQVLPSEKIGVELDQNALMSPRKSISGLFGICSADTAKEKGNACNICGKNDCPYRREIQ